MQKFDVMKYKDNIISAARNAGSLYVAVSEGSLRGDYEPTLSIDCWIWSSEEETEEKFIRSLCHTIEGDVDWCIKATSTDLVQKMGVMLIQNGEWCYG